MKSENNKDDRKKENFPESKSLLTNKKLNYKRTNISTL